MRWCLIAIVLWGCGDPYYRRVGPGRTFSMPGDTAAQTNPTSGQWSCDSIAQDGTCVEFVGSGWDQASMQNECGAVVTQAGCPSSDLLGRCQFAAGAALESVAYFYDGAYYSASDVPYLSSACFQGYGQWY